MASSPSRDAASSPRQPHAVNEPAARAAHAAIPRLQRLAGLALRGVTGAFQRMPRWLAYGIADVAALPLVAATLLHERRVAPLGRGIFRNQRIVFREQLTPGAIVRSFAVPIHILLPMV